MLNISYQQHSKAYFTMLRAMQLVGATEIDQLEAVTNFLLATEQIKDGMTISEVLELTRSTLENLSEAPLKKTRKIY
jgi:hypothetical protein